MSDVNELRSKLINIAAEIVIGDGFISPHAGDHWPSIPRSILKQAEVQQERLKEWGYQIRQVADGLLDLQPDDSSVSELIKAANQVINQWYEARANWQEGQGVEFDRSIATLAAATAKGETA